MNRTMGIRALVFLSAFAVAGCGIGKTNMLFVTKTNAGLDVSTKPPTAELDIARKEGVVGPQFEEGKKLPVMASFKFQNQGIFSPAVGSAFATGDAATTMAALYGDPTPYESWEVRASKAKSGALPSDSTLTLPNKPLPGNAIIDYDIKTQKVYVPMLDQNGVHRADIDGNPLYDIIDMPIYDEDDDPVKAKTLKNGVACVLEFLGLNPPLKYQTTDVRPVFFGTDTSLGVKAAWTDMATNIPDSVRLGYHRKELAFVPITMTEQSTNGTNPTTWNLKTASLLATHDTSVSVPGPAQIRGSNIQYFATGDAATLLAMQQDVRKAMLVRLDPNAEGYKKISTIGGNVVKQPGMVGLGAQLALIKIFEGLDTLTATDKIAQDHVARLNKIAAAYAPESVNLVTSDQASSVTLNVVNEPVAPTHLGLVTAITQIETSIQTLEMATKSPVSLTLNIHDGGSFSPVVRSLSGDDAKKLINEALPSLKEQHFHITRAFYENPDVAEAVQYYANIITGQERE